MASRRELLDARESLSQALLMAEAWHESYKSNPDVFRALVAQEAALERVVGEYLHDLASRAAQFVDWSVLKASSGVPAADDETWEEERRLLTVAVLQIITEVTALGLVGGEATYAYPIAFDSLDDAIMQSARKQVAQLVRGATDTTRKLIRESIAQSIALGEDSHAATLRLMEVIDNPIRAVTIAQTEPVNAYQSGYALYAKQTGAISKEWDGLIGACKICAPLIGTTVGIDEMFVLPNGAELAHPAGHPRCRCSLIYNYPE